MTNTIGEQAWTRYQQIEALVDRKYKLETIINISRQDALSMLLRIQHAAVQHELDAMRFPKKELEITNAMTRLDLAIQHKYSEVIPGAEEGQSTIDLAYVDSIDLYTLDTMLDAKCPEWEARQESLGGDYLIQGRYHPRRSVREALNLPWFFNLTGFQKPLWGKADSLRNVERELFPPTL